jgi:hypothetical protein
MEWKWRLQGLEEDLRRETQVLRGTLFSPRLCRRRGPDSHGGSGADAHASRHDSPAPRRQPADARGGAAAGRAAAEGASATERLREHLGGAGQCARRRAVPPRAHPRAHAGRLAAAGRNVSSSRAPTQSLRAHRTCSARQRWRHTCWKWRTTRCRSWVPSRTASGCAALLAPACLRSSCKRTALAATQAVSDACFDGIRADGGGRPWLQSRRLPRATQRQRSGSVRMHCGHHRACSGHDGGARAAEASDEDLLRRMEQERLEARARRREARRAKNMRQQVRPRRLVSASLRHRIDSALLSSLAWPSGAATSARRP